ncbi:hypothetical protein [Roseibacillus ishigakijimensis]|uniref:Uncharacterized protein n=1 Tax=Roseibacillus ishigakijimensis TaxID=454146 RepID=A0A934RP45_9BACT|nr:hypothetical protein [Roseibacillus ishigakijimensis]MBK1832976.1 hypothetical protein [Roseibacillus ishigakijimensis]
MKIPSLALLFLSLASVSWANDIRLRALTVSRGFPQGEVFLHSSNGQAPGQPIAIKTYLNHEFETARVESKSWVFTSEADPASVEDASKVLARAEVTEASPSYILIFQENEAVAVEPLTEEETPESQESEGLAEEVVESPAEIPGSVAVLPDSAQAFPPGGTLVLNLSDRDLRIELEETPYDCASQTHIVITGQKTKANNSSSMVVKEKDENGEWSSINSGSLSHPGDKRLVHLYSQRSPGGRIFLKPFRDIAEAE